MPFADNHNRGGPAGNINGRPNGIPKCFTMKTQIPLNPPLIKGDFNTPL